MPTFAPSQQRICDLFDYDEEAGWLVWRERPRSDFQSEAIWKTINSRQAGKRAGYTCPSSGYVQIGIDGRLYRAHRLIWMRQFGYWPVQIDHINHDRADNRLDNLQASSDAANRKNQTLSKRNSSGAVGVYWYARKSQWQAYISAGKKRYHLGYFSSKDDAIKARSAAAISHGFHENHGRAA